MNPDPAETTTGLRRILSYPAVYEAYDAVVGTRAVRRAFARQYVRPFPRAKVLDLGCGPARMLDHLSGVRYTGIDISAAYINAARKRYGNRGRFILGSVTDVNFGQEEPFDIVVAFGLLHHVSDGTVRDLVSRAKSVLTRSGRLITLDPCFVENQNILARYLHQKDRGNHVRYVEGYLKLVGPAFSSVTHVVRHDLHFIPSTTLIMTCLP